MFRIIFLSGKILRVRIIAECLVAILGVNEEGEYFLVSKDNIESKTPEDVK